MIWDVGIGNWELGILTGSLALPGDQCPEARPRFGSLKIRCRAGRSAFPGSAWYSNPKRVVNFLPHPNPPRCLGEGVRDSQMMRGLLYIIRF